MQEAGVPINAAVAERVHEPLAFRKLYLDDPRDDEILVKITAVGVCHTDMSMRDGLIACPLPAVLGHEGAGVVERIGKRVTKVVPGDHVILTTISCGACEPCLTGRPFYCDELHRLNLGGARADGSTTLRDEHNGCVHGAMFRQSSFANYSLSLERNTVKIPQDVPFEVAAPLGCGIQTGAGAVLNVIKPEIGSDIAVFGVGAVGMSAIMAAKVAACRIVIAVDINPQRLQLALELGATHAINAALEDPVEAIRRIVPGGVQYSLEAAGRPASLRNAVHALRMAGTCVLVGASGKGVDVEIEMRTLLSGRHVRGATMGESIAATFLPRLIDLYKKGLFPIERLVRTYPFEKINDAIDDSLAGTTVKAVMLL